MRMLQLKGNLVSITLLALVCVKSHSGGTDITSVKIVAEQAAEAAAIATVDAIMLADTGSIEQEKLQQVREAYKAAERHASIASKHPDTITDGTTSDEVISASKAAQDAANYAKLVVTEVKQDNKKEKVGETEELNKGKIKNTKIVEELKKDSKVGREEVKDPTLVKISTASDNKSDDIDSTLPSDVGGSVAPLNENLYTCTGDGEKIDLWRVGDGVCDCCDGADENQDESIPDWQRVECINTCKKSLAEVRRAKKEWEEENKREIAAKKAEAEIQRIAEANAKTEHLKAIAEAEKAEELAMLLTSKHTSEAKAQAENLKASAEASELRKAQLNRSEEIRGREELIAAAAARARLANKKAINSKPEQQKDIISSSAEYPETNTTELYTEKKDNSKMETISEENIKIGLSKEIEKIDEKIDEKIAKTNLSDTEKVNLIEGQINNIIDEVGEQNKQKNEQNEQKDEQNKQKDAAKVKAMEEAKKLDLLTNDAIEKILETTKDSVLNYELERKSHEKHIDTQAKEVEKTIHEWAEKTRQVKHEADEAREQTTNELATIKATDEENTELNMNRSKRSKAETKEFYTKASKQHAILLSSIKAIEDNRNIQADHDKEEQNNLTEIRKHLAGELKLRKEQEQNHLAELRKHLEEDRKLREEEKQNNLTELRNHLAEERKLRKKEEEENRKEWRRREDVILKSGTSIKSTVEAAVAAAAAAAAKEAEIVKHAAMSLVNKESEDITKTTSGALVVFNDILLLIRKYFIEIFKGILHPRAILGSHNSAMSMAFYTIAAIVLVCTVAEFSTPQFALVTLCVLFACFSIIIIPEMKEPMPFIVALCIAPIPLLLCFRFGRKERGIATISLGNASKNGELHDEIKSALKSSKVDIHSKKTQESVKKISKSMNTLTESMKKSIASIESKLDSSQHKSTHKEIREIVGSVKNLLLEKTIHEKAQKEHFKEIHEIELKKYESIEKRISDQHQASLASSAGAVRRYRDVKKSLSSMNSQMSELQNMIRNSNWEPTKLGENRKELNNGFASMNGSVPPKLSSSKTTSTIKLSTLPKLINTETKLTSSKANLVLKEKE